MRRDAAGRFMKGDVELRRKLRLMGSMGWVARTLATPLLMEAELVMTESKKQVPVVTSNLKNTGHVNPPEMRGNELSVELGYGSTAEPYALSVHENPRAGKTAGMSPSGKRYRKGTWSKVGKWKYLEDPLNDATPKIMKRLGLEVRYGVRKLRT